LQGGDELGMFDSRIEDRHDRAEEGLLLNLPRSARPAHCRCRRHSLAGLFPPHRMKASRMPMEEFLS
jgi:hypothetical protein